MVAKTHLLLIGLVAVAVVISGCAGIEFEDIEKTATRHQLREVEKRYEQFNGTYRIGIPDVLNVNVPDHPDLSGSYEVRPDGNISFPLLRDVYVEGLTPIQLSNLLAKELERFVKKVEVLVTMTGMYSRNVFVASRSSSRISMLRFTGDMTVLDVLAMNGGYTKQAYSSRIRLMRDNPEGKEIYKIRADHILRGDFTTNVLVKENDVLYVPATIMAEVGYVVDMFTYPLRSLVQGARMVSEAPYSMRYARERSRRATPSSY